MLKYFVFNVCLLAIIASIGECQKRTRVTTTTTSIPIAENVTATTIPENVTADITVAPVPSTTPKPKPTPLRFFSSLGTTQYLGMGQKMEYKEYYMSDVQVSS